MAQQNYKKFVATAATATLVASALVPVASANVTTSAFTDVPASYQEAVDFVVSNNISDGLTATQYGISQQIKRVDAAYMIAAAAGLNDKDAPNSGFSDVPARAAVAVNSLKAAGVVNGKSATKFGAQDNITRGEAAIMLQRAFDLKAGDVKNDFTDVKDSYDAAVDALVANKVTKGINATQFGTANPIKRGDFAKFLFALKDQIVIGNAVAEVTVVNETTTTAKLKEANKDLTAADFKVLVNGEAVTPEKVESDAKGEVYTITHATLKGSKGVVSVNGKQADFDFVSGVQVESVKAINAKEVKVSFSQPVSKASVTTGDFDVTLTGTTTVNAVTDVQVSEDGKTATLLLTNAIPAAGVDVEIAKGAILSKDYNEFPAFNATSVKVAQDTTAPKLVSSKAIDATTVELTFDEPVNWNGGGVRVNGGSLVPGTNNAQAGDYTYEFTVTSLNSGANTVQILNYADFAGNVENLTTTTVNYTADTSAPKVASIKTNESEAFTVTFNKTIDNIANTNFTVKKGNYTFNSSDLTVKYVDANGDLTASAGTTPSKYVKVIVPNQAGTANPLYANNENSVNLSVSLSGYKNDSIIGDDYNGSITLSKDLSAPKVVSSKLITTDKAAGTITVPFDKTLTAQDLTKVTLVKGNVKIAAEATVSGKNLVITSGTVAVPVALTDGTYNIIIDKGTVKDAGDNVNETTAVSTTVSSAVNYAQKTNIFSDAIFADGKNVVTVSYGEKVADTATEATSYLLNDAALPAGTNIYFTDTDKDTVNIELPASYKVDINKLSAKLTLKANALETDAGSVVSSSTTEGKAISEVVKLEDNVAPTLSKAVYVKDSNGLAIGAKLTFSEAVNTTSGDFTDDFSIKKGATVIPYTVATVSTGDTATDNVVILNFTGTSTAASGVTVETNSNRALIDLKDLSTNNKIAAFNVNVQ